MNGWILVHVGALLVYTIGVPVIWFLCRAHLQTHKDEVGALKNLIGELEKKMHRHPVTGLPDQAGFEAIASPIIGGLNRGLIEQVALAYIDLDKFKPINDRFGHACGDEVLRAVGQELQRAVRDTDVVAHLHGDEFAVLLPQSSEDDAVPLLMRFKERIEALRFEFNTNSKGKPIIPFSLTFGLKTTTNVDETFDSLMHEADMRMNAQKEKKGPRSTR